MKGLTMSLTTEDVVYRLYKRAEIRRQIPSRKSVQEGKPDRIADLLEEAAREIMLLRRSVSSLAFQINDLEKRIYEGA